MLSIGVSLIPIERRKLTITYERIDIFLKTQPNVILINCDDLGYGDLSCYGSTVHDTPNLDKMAEEGIRFTDFYMAASVCSPSRGAMLTGCYPKRIGFDKFDDGKWVLFPGNSMGLNPEEITIAKMLKQTGYHTKMIGKWHCGDQPEFLPTKHGFDEYYGIPYSNDMGRQAGAPRDLPPLPLMHNEEVLQAQPDQNGLTERYAEESVRFIRENADGNTPFFLYLAHMHVHLPLYVADRFRRESRNGAYGAAVACIDWVTGVLMDELKRQGLDEDTLIIFTSDNGSRNDNEGSNGQLRGRKTTSWEGGFRVPCIMHWPGTIEAGRVTDEIVTALDFLPTIANLSGASIPTDRTIDGHDISSFILSEKEDSPRDTFFYYIADNLAAVRSGKWKLHVWRHNQEVRELYNLETDPGETTNIIDQRPDIVASLDKLVEVCRKDLGDNATGTSGENCRPVGQVQNPDTLTHFDPEHPYIIAEYDLKGRG